MGKIMNVFIVLTVLLTFTSIQKVMAMTALEKMETVFVGDFSKWEIKASMDKALLAYGKRLDEQQYEKLGSALVGMRKETNVPEMVISACTVELKKQVTRQLSLPDAVGMCASAFENKYK